jgi:hypothetical protein
MDCVNTETHPRAPVIDQSGQGWGRPEAISNPEHERQCKTIFSILFVSISAPQNVKGMATLCMPVKCPYRKTVNGLLSYQLLQENFIDNVVWIERSGAERQMKRGPYPRRHELGGVKYGDDDAGLRGNTAEVLGARMVWGEDAEELGWCWKRMPRTTELRRRPIDLGGGGEVEITQPWRSGAM